MNSRNAARFFVAGALAILCGFGCARPADVPEIARTDAELAVLLARYDATAKRREIEYYRSCAEASSEHAWNITLAAHRFLYDVEKYQASTTQADATTRIMLAVDFDAAKSLFRQTIDPGCGGKPTTWAAIEDRARRRFIGRHQVAERLLAAPGPADVRFNGITLNHAIDFMRDWACVQIQVQWSALMAAGLDMDTKLSFHYQDKGSFGDALKVLLKHADPKGTTVIAPFDNVIVISTPAALEQTRRRMAATFANSDPAGRNVLRSCQQVRAAFDSLPTFANLVAPICGRRVVIDKHGLSDEVLSETYRSISLECPFELSIRLFLDSLDLGQAPWTFKIVGDKLIFEPETRKRSP